MQIQARLEATAGKPGSAQVNPMAHQQLHAAAVAEVVGFKLIGQMQARSRWGAGKAAEVDGVDGGT